MPPSGLAPSTATSPPPAAPIKCLPHAAAVPGMNAEYDEHSKGQRVHLLQNIKHLLDDAATLPLDSSTLCVADFGCATGANTATAAEILVSRLRERTQLPILYAHVDLPTNLWSELHAHLARDPYHSRYKDVYPVSVGRSFYEQVLPPGSLHLGICSASIHWLSRRPLERASAVDPARLTAEERAAFAAVAAEDWRSFAPDPASPWLGLWTDAAAALEAEGRITRAERGAMVLPVHLRARAEFEAPFASGPVAGVCLQVVDEPPAVPSTPPRRGRAGEGLRGAGRGGGVGGALAGAGGGAGPGREADLAELRARALAAAARLVEDGEPFARYRPLVLRLRKASGHAGAAPAAAVASSPACPCVCCPR
eukprot:tig00021127_g18876.t1